MNKIFLTFSALAFVRSAVSQAVTHVVDVGGAQIAYNPTFVNANAGDTVAFVFHAKNHSATQSSFAQPCVALEGGLDTGFQPVSADQTTLPVEAFVVPDTNPIWFYCKQVTHCPSFGMVFAVNPGSQFAAFQAAATASASTSASQPPATASVTYTTNVYSTTASTSSPTPTAPSGSGGGTTHVVVVGGGGNLTYVPDTVTAAVGDTISFQFVAKNHTATQSSFTAPCRELALTSTSGQVGFDSGFNPIANGTTVFPTYNITVNDTNPIWVYCRQSNPASHCGKGMVFAANAPASGSNTFAAFQSSAISLNGTAASGTPSGSGSATGSSSSPSPSTGSAAGLERSVGFVLMAVSLWLGFTL